MVLIALFPRFQTSDWRVNRNQASSFSSTRSAACIALYSCTTTRYHPTKHPHHHHSPQCCCCCFQQHPDSGAEAASEAVHSRAIHAHKHLRLPRFLLPVSSSKRDGHLVALTIERTFELPIVLHLTIEGILDLQIQVGPQSTAVSPLHFSPHSLLVSSLPFSPSFPPFPTSFSPCSPHSSHPPSFPLSLLSASPITLLVSSLPFSPSLSLSHLLTLPLLLLSPSFSLSSFSFLPSQKSNSA